MKDLITYIKESIKWDDWEKEYYNYRKENGFKGSIDDLIYDKDGFSSEMAMDFYQLYLQDKKDKATANKYNREISKFIDSEEAKKTSPKDKNAEEIALLIASAIESVVPVETENIEIPFTKGLKKNVQKVNYKGINIFIYDKCYQFSYGSKGYASKPGFTILCSDDAKYHYGNLIDCEVSTGKYDQGRFKKWLRDSSTIDDLCKIIDKTIGK